MPFSRNKKSRQPDPDEEQIAFIGQGTVLSGRVVSTKPLVIDGTIHGNIDCSTTVMVGDSGVVIGEIHSPMARISGRIFGDLHVPTRVELIGNANIQGDIFTGSLHVEPSVIFNGRCHIPQQEAGMSKEEVERVISGKS